MRVVAKVVASSPDELGERAFRSGRAGVDGIAHTIQGRRIFFLARLEKEESWVVRKGNEKKGKR